jgi:hypothetical protein
MPATVVRTKLIAASMLIELGRMMMKVVTK